MARLLWENAQERAGGVEGVLRMEAKAAMPLGEAVLCIQLGLIAALLVAPSVNHGWMGVQWP